MTNRDNQREELGIHPLLPLQNTSDVNYLNQSNFMASNKSEKFEDNSKARRALENETSHSDEVSDIISSIENEPSFSSISRQYQDE